MSDMHMRDKLRRVTEAAKNGEHIPEHSKNVGLTLFFIFSFIGILCIITFAVALFIYKHYGMALIAFLIALLYLYVTIKLRSAETIPKE